MFSGLTEQQCNQILDRVEAGSFKRGDNIFRWATSRRTSTWSRVD